MNKTNGTTTVTGQHISRGAKVMMAAILVIGAAVGTIALFRPAPEPAATPSAVVAATASARLLALDQSLFSAVGTSDNTAARNARLRALNERLYPDDSTSSAAARNQRLLDLNNRFYPPDAGVAAGAATTNARLLELNNRLYPPDASAATTNARLLELNNRLYPPDSIQNDQRSPRDARLLKLNQ